MVDLPPILTPGHPYTSRTLLAPPPAKGTLAAPGLPERSAPELHQPTPHLAPATSDPQPCPKHTSTQGVAQDQTINSLGMGGGQGPAGAGTGLGTRALGWRLRASIWLWCRRPVSIKEGPTANTRRQVQGARL